MMIPVRNAVRILLLNDNKLLLMRVEDLDIGAPGAKSNRRFWCTIGGGIEPGESVQDAALREIYEETSLMPEAIELGPIVWKSDINLMLRGTLTRFMEVYVVAKTKAHDVRLHQPTETEQAVVKELRWSTLEDINKCPDLIFPDSLATYLPDILAGNYPPQLICIDGINAKQS